MVLEYIAELKNDRKKILALVSVVLLLAGMFLAVLWVQPTKIVEAIGEQNGYLLLFVLSLVGGYSVAGTVSAAVLTLLLTLAAGGLNPIYLGLIAGSGLAAGDTVMLFVCYKARNLVPDKWENKLKASWFDYEEGKTPRTLPLFAYLYMAFTPLPNDILLLFLASVRYPMRKTFFVLVMGDISYALLLSHIGAYFA